ncbi:bifunctional GNAT family N-acetyltransferase/acetate--CoA ligase family protein [Nocardioides sp. Root190]|uniref:bifunctional acetate--CoA ligase family protein/GNAT family N-acetyltransferase n=1 Tax=Nocardioides sp. Root190 TaxID=1736488 RepID=UPI000AD41841|nr:bifunctional GNAT family N-acetyltransferase/acetate--CoA ligase family protein [Nocardioides sp. Root190]
MTTADVLLADGAVATIRTIRPGDGAALDDLHQRASRTSLWLRFFTGGSVPAHAYVEHVLSSSSTIARVAWSGDRAIGLATAEPVDGTSAEVAFLVDDELRGHGLGTLLLEHLAAAARDRGIHRFTALVLAENARMLEVFADAGFHTTTHRDGGEVELRLDITVTAVAQTAADRREFSSEARSLRPLLTPRSVALYGVRRDGSGLGAAILAAIVRGGFAGSLVVVHPRGEPVGGVPTRASLAGAPLCDLAVIAVPASGVLHALDDATAHGVGAAVVIASGFGEMGEEGTRLQAELGALARRRGVRLVGPNCLGVLCNDPDVRLNATFGLGAIPSGGLAVASQSGGVGIALMELLAKAEVGVRSFVSLGNKVDVSGNDLLAAWYDDPDVTCAALYLESFGNARKFARFARAFAERKPLVAVVGGRSTSGRRAGQSHTAAAASPDAGVRALFAQSGVIDCHDAESLAETVTVLTSEPLPAGPRLAVISNAGGLGILAADAAEEAGLVVTELSPQLQSQVQIVVANTSGATNPVDVGAGADAEQLGAVVERVLSSGEVDSVVVVLVATDTNDVDAAHAVLSDVRARHADRPLLVVLVGGSAAAPPGVTTMPSARAAVDALGRVARYVQWRRVPVGLAPAPDARRALSARADARSLVEAGTADGWASPEQASSLLQRYGLGLIGVVVGGEDAPRAAAGLGFPVAVKVVSADVVHRTERRLVATGLVSGSQVADAVARFAAEGAAGRVVVQPMVRGTEVALGLVRDPSLGPLVMIAPGGITTELATDRVLLVPPFSADEVMRALRSMTTWPLLDGFRGAAPLATEDLAETVTRIGQLAIDVPELVELDLNPVIVTPDGVHLVDVKARFHSALAGGEARQLRPLSVT